MNNDLHSSYSIELVPSCFNYKTQYMKTAFMPYAGNGSRGQPAYTRRLIKAVVASFQNHIPYCRICLTKEGSSDLIMQTAMNLCFCCILHKATLFVPLTSIVASDK